MVQLNKLFIIFSFSFIIFNKAYSQTGERFYITNDTIIIEKPIVISLKNIDGMFLISEDDLKKDLDVVKLMKKDKLYLFNNDVYRFLSLKELNKKPRYSECLFEESYTYSDKINIKKLNSKILKFRIGLIKIDYYNEKTLTVDKGKTIFDNKNHLYYCKILFPLCE
ncbi:hypothetical protein Q361_1782 [Flavobacterium croceum DSM 17960]|uniref:Uncharacterized protein n=1 Tax=Flavobacterium croceum DSM 17960 TaxID=1121886 RepID=A0A2S4N4A7_9FLAO|nr:hypothetical protein [Flavobacterium croceum]POS00521.1 hypothetical protein Q361_1782 [Flavobacterium croceum DSM 17960]